MARPADQLVLRRGFWPGFTDATILDSGDQRFRQLVNCYVSNEGTELRRFPGFRPAAIPDFEQPFIDSITNEMEIASYPDSTGPMVVTLSRPHGQLDGLQAYVVITNSQFKDDGQGTSRIQGFFTPPTVLNRVGIDGIYAITFNNNTARTLTTFTINSGIATSAEASIVGGLGGDPAGRAHFFQNSGGAIEDETPLYIFFRAWNKLRIPHALASIRDRLLVIGESDYRRTFFIKGEDDDDEVEYLVSYTGTSGSPLETTITVQVDASHLFANYMPVQFEWVMFENITGPGAAALNGKTLEVASAIATFTPGSPATVVFTVWTGGIAISAGTHAQVAPARVSMVRAPHSDSYSLTAYTLLARPNIQNPQLVDTRAALVANTIRDWGGRFGFLQGEGYRGRTKRKVKQLPRRVSVDVAADRVLLAAPGYGVAFQVPAVIPVTDVGSAGVPFHPNTAFDKPRCVGQPKGVIHEVAPTLVNGKTEQVEAGVVSSNNLVGPSAGNLTELPVTPGSVVASVVTASGTNVLRDNGAGVFVQFSGPDTITLATINYTTGAVSIDMSANVTSGSFTYNSDTAVLGFQSISTPNGTYRLCVAYVDDYTGEIGMPSDFIETTVTAPNAESKMFIQVQYLHPGYLVSECLATSINIYCSAPDEETMGLARNVKIPPFGTEPPWRGGSGVEHVEALVKVNLFNFDPSDVDRKDIDFSQAPRVVSTMPMGGKAVRTNRAHTFYGGGHGDLGQRNELQSGGLTAKYDEQNVATGNPATESNHRRRDQIVVRLFDRLAAQLDTPFNMASAGIPPGYTGRKLFSRELFTDDPQVPHWPSAASNLGGTFPPGPLLDKMFEVSGPKSLHHGFLNLYPDDAVTGPVWPESWWPRWAVRNYLFVREHTYNANNEPCFMVLPRGQFWFSEKGRPGEIAGINSLYLDAEGEEDVEAIGRLGSRTIICTRNHTFGLSFGVSPQGSSPVSISSSRGCIAPNTMSESDTGLHWLSERGPLMLSDVWRWTGRHVQESFIGISARYVRDLQGMMCHAWSCHDVERGLVYYGLRTNRLSYTLVDQAPDSTFVSVTWDTATEDQKTKFPCDEVLIYSYNADAWSVWRPRFNIHWMQRVMCADGIYRIVFLAEDLILYALDEAAQDTNFEPVKGVASTVGTATTVFVAAAPFANLTSDGGYWVNNTRVVAGMQVAIYSGTTKQLKHLNTIATTPSDDSLSVSLVNAVSWAIGDIIQIGLLDMEIETNKMAHGAQGAMNITETRHVKAVSMRGAFYSRLSADPTLVVGYSGANPPLCWALVSLDSEIEQDVEISAQGTRAAPPINNYSLLADRSGVSAPGVPIVQQWNRGANRGHEMSMRFRAVGGQQLRINNFALIFEEAGK